MKAASRRLGAEGKAFPMAGPQKGRRSSGSDPGVPGQVQTGGPEDALEDLLPGLQKRCWTGERGHLAAPPGSVGGGWRLNHLTCSATSSSTFQPAGVPYRCVFGSGSHSVTPSVLTPLLNTPGEGSAVTQDCHEPAGICSALYRLHSADILRASFWEKGGPPPFPGASELVERNTMEVDPRSQC